MARQSDIRALVDQFTEQLQLVIRRLALQQVLGALSGSPPGRPRGRPRKAGSPARRGGKRSSAELDEIGSRLLAHVQRNPGQRGDQIAKALGTDVGTMRLPMSKLIGDKKVRTKGQRRGTTYYPAGAVPRGRTGKARAAKRGKARRRGRRKSAK